MLGALLYYRFPFTGRVVWGCLRIFVEKCAILKIASNRFLCSLDWLLSSINGPEPGRELLEPLPAEEERLLILSLNDECRVNICL